MIALLYIPISVLMGWFNAHLVNTWVDWSKGRRIKHFWNGLVHFAGAVGVWALLKYGNIPAWLDGKPLQGALAVFPIARVFFNETYNFFHIPRQSIGYTSLEPKSIVDKVEQKLFGKDGITPLILYLFLIVVLLFA